MLLFGNKTEREDYTNAEKTAVRVHKDSCYWHYTETTQTCRAAELWTTRREANKTERRELQDKEENLDPLIRRRVSFHRGKEQREGQT